MQVTQLRCEYFVNPLGLDTRSPRLSWQIEDARRGVMQSAYQILVAGDEKTLAADKGDLWDTARVATDQSVHVAYAGQALRSRQRAWWKVRVWDDRNEASAWSAAAFFEMGLLDRGDWKARWIGSPIVGGPYSIPPAPYLRRNFDVSRPIARARLYATALGLYEFEINGKRVGENVFVPGRTEYGKRVPYHVYDVTSQLSSGTNAIGAILGDGWYCGHLHSDPRQTYGDRPRLFAQLVIDYADGSSQTIATDASWKAGEGPIRASDILMGEDYDARMEIPGWSTATFDDSRWQPVVDLGDPKIEVIAHRAPPPRKIQEIKPIAPPNTSLNKRRHIFDLGQNMVGWVRLRVRNAPPGKTIDLRFVEMLDKDGKPYTTALRTARATDHYTTRGGTEEIFEPRFTFHGFRYVEVRDYPGSEPPMIDDVTGVVIHSDTEPTGEFECSDPLVNQLQHNIVWSQKGNFLDIPTDCPQRDERLGWTGDAQVFIRTAAFNMEVANFFAKWLQDVADAQYEDGHVPSVVPHVHSIYHEGGPAWSDACVICPWVVYQCYGDTRIIEQCWPMMTKFMDWLDRTSPGRVRADENAKWRGYGDWLTMDAHTPQDLIGIAFYAYCAKLMSKMAAASGKKDESAKYCEIFQDVRRVWQRRYVTPDGLILAQTQTAYVLALHFDLLEPEARPKVLEALVRNIRSRGMHLSTGFVGTPYLNPVLTRFGRSDVAFALLVQKTFPSWLFPVTHGATTMWERWDGWTPEKGFNDAGMNSYNHYAYGAVGEWMYSTVAGVDLDPDRPGYKHIVIRPEFSGAMTYVKAKLRSLYGPIESHWKIEGDHVRIEIAIPPNTTATVRIPTDDAASVTESNSPAAKAPGISSAKTEAGVAIFEVGSGRYSFRAKLPRSAEAAAKSHTLGITDVLF